MSVICMSMYSYTEVCTFPQVVLHVRTKYVLFFLSTYLVHTPMYCVYKILQGMLFYVVRLWETILCVRGMYAVVLQHLISAPNGVQHT